LDKQVMVLLGSFAALPTAAAAAAAVLLLLLLAAAALVFGCVTATLPKSLHLQPVASSTAQNKATNECLRSLCAVMQVEKHEVADSTPCEVTARAVLSVRVTKTVCPRTAALAFAYEWVVI
jgi:hypothetical protein